MFDIGFLELLIIGVVGLLVLGPERLPKAARTAGLWIGKIKRTVSNMQREISSQLEAEELRQKLDVQQKKLDESLNKIKQDVESYAEPAPTGEKSEGEPQQSSSGQSSRNEQQSSIAAPQASRSPTATSEKPQHAPTISGSVSDKDTSSR